MLTKEPKAAGHTFVVKADVTAIDCDAWLCPTDAMFSVTAGFAQAVGLSRAGRLKGFRWNGAEAIPFNPQRDGGPLIVLGAVGRRRPKTPEQVARHVAQLQPVVDAFIRVAVDHCRPNPSRKQLRLGLPLIGTGHGGLNGVKGDAIKPLLTTLNKNTYEHHVDIILCTDNDLAWSAVQASRDAAWGLTEVEEELAQRLADVARAGQLVLFIGAGVSSDAGLPGWQTLLNELRPAKLPTDQRKQLEELDFRDQATLIAKELGGRDALLNKIDEILSRYQQ